MKRILALQDKEIAPEAFYKEWKKLHRMNMDHANAGLFINEEAIFRCDLKQLYLEFGIERDANSDVRIMIDTLVYI